MITWINFNVNDEIMHVNICVEKLIDVLPDDIDKYCMEIYPVIDKINEFCNLKKLNQIAIIDYDRVKIHKINPLQIVKLVWNIHNYTKDQKLLKSIENTGADPVINTIIASVRGILPPFISI